MKKVRLNRDISILYRYGQRFFACRLAPLGVEVGQLPVLMQVYQMPGTTQDALSVGRGFDKGTTARVAKSLEDAGLLRRETDPDDRRINHLYPTGRALALRPQVEAVIDELHGVLYRGLSGEEIAQASALVARMRRNLADEIDRQRSSK
ncbi:MarR family winged helix-turn-helix transcriptional regulator [Anaerotruncus massiliensis (ex Togo et al. 2019)]|nr:MarR family transcriptional regulator [Anaerotruncus massiliensis (ex Togo et al. 2019)]GKH47620.1 MarR family transcriptional regulator [Oscillospiraceae bacterium]